jgi:hypothetical protein
MIGTALTENAPPVTTAVPYKRSQIPGSEAVAPKCQALSVSNPPTIIGGAKLSTNFRPGPVNNDEFALRAFVAAAGAAMQTATNASINQTASHLLGARRYARYAAPNAEMPIAKPPHPGTAVNSAAFSIVSRMYRR